MINFARLLPIAFAALCCPSAYACDLPEPVTIPDGKTATAREMAAAGQAMEKHFLEYERYEKCIHSETQARRESAYKRDISSSKLREEDAAEKLNAAAAAVEDLAQRFNNATAEYESRKP